MINITQTSDGTSYSLYMLICPKTRFSFLTIFVYTTQ